MTHLSTDQRFAGALPEIYDTYLVPLIFEHYATDLAERLRLRSGGRVLEIAAGTGVVTRALAASLPEVATIVATDRNQAMLDKAATLGTTRPVEWRAADAMQLPFADATFDTVVCQFGVMFFPDKAKAFAEARRVLTPGASFVFNVWDRIEDNEFADEVTAALASVFPGDPPRFMVRTPHGYHDTAVIVRDLGRGGFAAAPDIVTLPARSRARSPRDVAIAFVQGTPLRNEIEARDPARMSEAVDVSAEAIARRFGRGAVDGRMQAHVVSVTR